MSYAEISHLRCDLALSWDASGAMPRAGGLRWVMEIHTVLHEPLVSWDTQKYTNLHVSTPQTIRTWLKPLLEGGIVDTVRQKKPILAAWPWDVFVFVPTGMPVNECSQNPAQTSRTSDALPYKSSGSSIPKQVCICEHNFQS